MVRKFIPSDTGKDVIDPQGERIGIVAEVEEQTAYIEPIPPITTRIRRRLGLGEGETETFPVSQERVASIEGEEIHLEE